MYDYEYVFAKTLQLKLMDHILAGVQTWVTGDVLYVSIKRDENNLQYVMEIPQFSERIRNGWTTDYAAYEVMRSYKSFVMKKLFK